MPKTPRHKWSRREGVDLFNTGDASLQRRLGTPPGGARQQQGRRRRGSDYTLQLREKQKLKRMYGMRESQFRKFFDMAVGKRGNTGLILLQLLESRLDNVIYRLGFARSRLMSRQIVSHGHVLVDGRRVDIPSFLVRPGMTVQLSGSARKSPMVQEFLEAPAVPTPRWLERTDGGGRVLDQPSPDDIGQDIDTGLIVAFYSR